MSRTPFIVTPRELNQRLVADIESVVPMLLPSGKLSSGEWRVGSIAGEAGQSLGVRMTGTKAGVWSDFAAGGGGDLLDLWREVKCLTMAETLREVREYLGIREPRFEAPRKSYQRPEPPKAATDEDSPAWRWLVDERKITPETLHRFGIRTRGRTVLLPFERDGELVMLKQLGIDPDENGRKRTRPTCADQEPALFGWQAIEDSTRRVLITEGEIDAMSFHEYGFPALSVPYGGGGGEKQSWIANELPHLDRFDEILVAMDNDPVGEEAAAEIVSRLGRHRCRIVRLPRKDANECLQAGIPVEAINRCIDRAEMLDPEELKPATAYTDELLEAFNPTRPVIGMRTPWRKVGERIVFRPGEVSVWTGWNGHGKSQATSYVMAGGIRQGERVCIASMEMRPVSTLKRMTRQITATGNPTEQYIRASQDWLAGKLWLFDLVGTAKVDRLLEVFAYARARYGVTQFVVDSLAKCGIDEDDYNGQKALTERLVDFAHEHNGHVHLVAHSRKGASEHTPPGKLDIKGTGAITDLADNVFTVWRNKVREEKIADAEKCGVSPDPETLEAPSCVIYCSKQRNGDWEGKVATWFDPGSYQYLAAPNHKARPLIEHFGEPESETR